MGLFLMSEIPTPPVSHPPASAADRLVGLLQEGRSLERYVEEFVELAYVTNWPDACLNALFLEGLDESTIRFDEPADHLSLVDTINLILYLNGSKFVIEEVPDIACISRSIPPETRAAWPVRWPPSSSACPSSELFLCVLLDPQPSAGSRRPKRRRRKTKPAKFPEFSASMQPKFPEFSAPVQPKFPEFSASEQPKFPEFSASEQPKFPEFSAPVQPKFPEFSASEQPKFPEFSAPVQPKFPEFSASEQPKFPELSVSEQPKFPELSVSEQPKFPEFSASVQPKFPEFPAVEPAPVPVGLLIEFEGMNWTPFPGPAPALAEPAPSSAEPAPSTAEPAPACHEPAPSSAEPAPSTAEPAPACHEPAPAPAAAAEPLRLQPPPPSPRQPPLNPLQ
ncbi:uncharacterized protein LOC127518723 [Ctenopharyngodon idella]|uniref:uncharacterized protein LOC127518723 n=1 Tax=Ctenopharyngodon idella TaxID=7959 RepID=UPI00222FB58B|nr:uncharacterized protein LOC127518723 [Ctenopharyngodon idella]